MGENNWNFNLLPFFFYWHLKSNFNITQVIQRLSSVSAAWRPSRRFSFLTRQMQTWHRPSSLKPERWGRVHTMSWSIVVPTPKLNERIGLDKRRRVSGEQARERVGSTREEKSPSLPMKFPVIHTDTFTLWKLSFWNKIFGAFGVHSTTEQIYWFFLLLNLPTSTSFFFW